LTPANGDIGKPRNMAQGARGSGPLIRASMRFRSFALLAGAAAFIVQLFLAPLHLAVAAPSSTSSTSLAELMALTGQHNVLCGDAADHQPDNPVHGGADCPGLCCQLGHHGLAAFLPPQPACLCAVIRQSSEIGPPHAISLRARTHSPNAQPRGPPVTL